MHNFFFLINETFILCMNFVFYILKTVKIILRNVNFTVNLQSQSNDFVNSHSLCILIKISDFSFPNIHVKKENMSVIFVPSFCHSVAEADLLSLVRFQTCNNDSGVLSNALPELKLIKQIKAFFVHNQIENVSNETIYISVLLKMYICINDL